MKSIAFADMPCPRCGAPQKVAKIWKETVQTFTGTMEVDCKQIICTNTVCQEEFEKNLQEDTQKREKRKAEREQREKVRKANMYIRKKKVY